MMDKIYKYTLDILDEQLLTLPAGSRILSVAEQYGKIVIYAIVDTELAGHDYFKFYIRGTGHPFGINLVMARFLGTVKLYDGAIVFHVFYESAITGEE